MPQYVYKLCLLLLVFSLSTYSIELSFIISILAILVSLSSRLSVNFFKGIFLVSTVSFIGLISSFQAYNYPIYDVIKDIIYFLRPISILLASYFLIKRLESKYFVFNTIVVVALFFAVIHLLNVLIHINSIDSYIYLRSLGGKQNHIEIIAIVFLIFTPYITIFKRYKKLVTFIIFLSFVLYLSRTMFIILFIFFLGYKGYLFLNKRLIKGVLLFLTITLALGYIISNVETNRDSKGFKAFIYKAQNSFTELFKPVDTNIVLRDRRTLWEHWRAYEAQKAIEQVNKNGLKAWLIGLGYGPQIELETNVKLDGNVYTKVPSIHNGFVYVFFKTGVIGFSFYFFFIIYMFFRYQKFNPNKSDSILNKLIIATSLYVFFNSLVITGFYRPGEFSLFLYAILIAYKEKLDANLYYSNNISTTN